MSLQIGTALKDGLDQTLSRTSAILIGAYMAIYLVYMVGYNGLMNSLYGSLEVQTTSLQPALDVSPVINGGIVAVCMIAMLYLTVVTIRTFVAGEKRSIPSQFLTDGVPFAMANLFVGGLVYSILVAVGSVFLFVPGIILYVGLVFMIMYVAAENENFVTALKRSWNVTKGEKWSIFGLLLAISVIGFVGGFVVGIVGMIVMFALGPGTFTVLLVLVMAPYSMFNVAVLAAAFNQVRANSSDGPVTESTTTDAPSTPA